MRCCLFEYIPLINSRCLYCSKYFMKLCPVGIWCQNDVVSTSMRRDHVASTLIRRHFNTKCPLGAVQVNESAELWIRERVGGCALVKVP